MWRVQLGSSKSMNVYPVVFGPRFLNPTPFDFLPTSDVCVVVSETVVSRVPPWSLLRSHLVSIRLRCGACIYFATLDDNEVEDDDDEDDDEVLQKRVLQSSKG